jgi:outer membrane murein-binding lipoprotein Lpp
MTVVNTTIAACVGLFLVWAFASNPYVADRESIRAERQLMKKAVTAARSDMANANASLPQWDDKNYKGLTYRP